MSVRENKYLNRFNEEFNDKKFFIDFNNLDDAFIDVSNEYLQFLELRKRILNNALESIDAFKDKKIPHSGLCSLIRTYEINCEYIEVLGVTRFIQSNPTNIYDGPRSYASSSLHFTIYEWKDRKEYLIEVINLNDLLIEEVVKRLEKL